MKLTQSITSFVCLIAFAACGPTSEECAAFDNQADCLDAGCDVFSRAEYFSVVDGQCTTQGSEPEYLCYRTRDGDKTGESAPAGHYDVVDSSQVLILPQSAGPILGGCVLRLR